jgi:Protein of unknown function (DUF2892)
MMQLNIGSVDRFVRVVIGVILLSLALVLPGQLKLISLLGLIPIFTAFFRWCPLYTLFGLSTCPLRTKK